MILRLSLLLTFAASPALADIPTIDGTVLQERVEHAERTAQIGEIEEERYAKRQSVTCAMFRQGRKDDPVGAAKANPAISSLVRRVAQEQGVDENQFLALVYQESHFDPCAKSPAGAIGLSQLMPSTARDLGVDPYDVTQNLQGGARYYKLQLARYKGSLPLALAAYNAGHANVQKYGGVPPFRETQGYVAAIMEKWLPAFGGAHKSGIPVNYGGSGSYERARTSTMNAMGLTAAVGQGTGDIMSWLSQPGHPGSGTVRDSWDHNSGARAANLELMNQLVQLGTAFAELANSNNAITLGAISGANRSTRFEQKRVDGDELESALCIERKESVWDPDANACILRIDTQAGLLLEAR